MKKITKAEAIARIEAQKAGNRRRVRAFRARKAKMKANSDKKAARAIALLERKNGTASARRKKALRNKQRTERNAKNLAEKLSRKAYRALLRGDMATNSEATD